MKITFVPKAGLCNRIGAVLSAMEFKRHNPDIYFRTYWGKDRECHALFSDLFEPIKDFEILPLEKFYLKPSSRWNLYLPDILKRIYFDKYFYCSSSNRENFECLIRNFENIWVGAYNPFTKYSIDNSIAKVFVPLPEIADRISKITEQYQNNVIGIHVRQTDNIPAINNNPIEKFYALMDHEIEENESCLFYLATDSYEIKNIFKKKYNDRIITADISLTRTNVTGIKNAVVDLYCLGATKKIFGSSHSTYSEIASKLYNIDLII